MVGRRTERRVHLFRPDSEMNQFFLFCLAVALQRTGISLVAVVLMGNHYHFIVEDHHGRITLLTELLNGWLTQTTKVLRGWTGRVFDGEGPSYVELLTPQVLIEKIGYVIANPTAAGLVRHASEWPGVTTRPEDIGVASMMIPRPERFFAQDGDMPEEVELRFELPDVLMRIYGVKQARERIAAAVAQHEQKAHEKAAKLRWTFKGAERVLKGSPYSRAKTLEDRGKLNPRYAGDTESIKAAVARHREFVRRYRQACDRWKNEETGVIWPAGTDALFRRYHVARHAPG